MRIVVEIFCDIRLGSYLNTLVKKKNIYLNPHIIDEKQLPDRMEITEDETKEITIDISNEDVSPRPEFEWYLDDKQVNLEESLERNGLSHTVKYRAKLDDSGRRLTCRILQMDDEDNVVETKISTLLKIHAKPEDMNTLGVGGIVGISVGSVLILIILILVLFLWITNRACFAAPKRVIVQQPKPSQGNADTQTNAERGQAVGVGVNMGPEKPPRSASRDELSQPLLGQAPQDCSDSAKLEILLSPDELTGWNEEGQCGKATSLSSLETYVSERDWESTLRSFGPKFASILDMVNGEVEDNETSTNERTGGGTEV